MDKDRFVSVYNKEFVSYFSKEDEAKEKTPPVVYEECSPRPVFYFTKPKNYCNWKSCSYVVSMPQKYPYIYEALKTDIPEELLKLNRDYYKAINQVGYCRMRRTCDREVPKQLIDCYKLVCKPFIQTECVDKRKSEIEELDESSQWNLPDSITQPKPSLITGSNKDQMAPKLLRKFTDSVAAILFPPMDGVSEYYDTISKLGDRLLP